MKNVALCHSSFTFHFDRRRYQMQAALSHVYRQALRMRTLNTVPAVRNEGRDKHSEFFVTAPAAFEMQFLTA
jgi:hypothetical protein